MGTEKIQRKALGIKGVVGQNIEIRAFEPATYLLTVN